MSSFKKIIFTGLFLGISSLPLLAHAANSLTIKNNTPQDSTAIINNGSCSANALGEKGITKGGGGENTIDSFVIWYACYSNPHNCKADVYMTNNCTGPKVATVLFDTDTGIKSITMLSNQYAFIGSGFSVTLNGGA
jgi:hypothetical protein